MSRPASPSTAQRSSDFSTDSSFHSSAESTKTPPAKSIRLDHDPDGRAFRNALGQFATGVTVLTTRTAAGTPIGVTISSFNTVSLDPPLILWSLSLNSPKLDLFRNAGHYAVNVLTVDQTAIADWFASPADDRFAGLQPRDGLGGIPLLEECAAWFECAPEAVYPGGDHLIFVGRVTRFSWNDRQPLIFHAGRYRQLL
ncbi:MAG TPA: flavin reductase family protein [Accumulibacter sp.]|nr:flavin reductase family protein [Accumulibacter sp.]HMX23313.1 flavin reductase family protein [Accumulibacter sp.]HMY06456.1 flavin reductase family protein [Accumulibacter sp.]HNC16997.1 flavin reductase family protein [Accumulibacter sp.]HND80891.1 flavin reductase family protein [Accumulibacter sp.]